MRLPGSLRGDMPPKSSALMVARWQRVARRAPQRHRADSHGDAESTEEVPISSLCSLWLCGRTLSSLCLCGDLSVSGFDETPGVSSGGRATDTEPRATKTRRRTGAEPE